MKSECYFWHVLFFSAVYSEASLKREKVRRQIDFASAPSDTMDTNNNGPRSMLKSRSGEERNESPDLFDDSQDLFGMSVILYSKANSTGFFILDLISL